MTILNSETNSFVFEDHDFDVACDWRVCDNAAEWSGNSRCCGKLWLFCTEHLEVNQSVGTPDGPPAVVCPACQTYHYRSALVNIQSLKG